VLRPDFILNRACVAGVAMLNVSEGNKKKSREEGGGYRVKGKEGN
jgi:hypothetical protein